MLTRGVCLVLVCLQWQCGPCQGVFSVSGRRTPGMGEQQDWGDRKLRWQRVQTLDYSSLTTEDRLRVLAESEEKDSSMSMKSEESLMSMVSGETESTGSATTIPANFPTKFDTKNPTKKPTKSPTSKLTNNPTTNPTAKETTIPSIAPTAVPTAVPTPKQTPDPAFSPTKATTAGHLQGMTSEPTEKNSEAPAEQTVSPLSNLSSQPPTMPTGNPAISHSGGAPSDVSTKHPTPPPTYYPTLAPTTGPISIATPFPTSALNEVSTPFPTAESTPTSSSVLTLESKGESTPFPTSNYDNTVLMHDAADSVRVIIPTFNFTFFSTAKRQVDDDEVNGILTDFLSMFLPGELPVKFQLGRLTLVITGASPDKLMDLASHEFFVNGEAFFLSETAPSSDEVLDIILLSFEVFHDHVIEILQLSDHPTLRAVEDFRVSKIRQVASSIATNDYRVMDEPVNDLPMLYIVVGVVGLVLLTSLSAIYYRKRKTSAKKRKGGNEEDVPIFNEESVKPEEDPLDLQPRGSAESSVRMALSINSAASLEENKETLSKSQPKKNKHKGKSYSSKKIKGEPHEAEVNASEQEHSNVRNSEEREVSHDLEEQKKRKSKRHSQGKRRRRVESPGELERLRSDALFRRGSSESQNDSENDYDEDEDVYGCLGPMKSVDSYESGTSFDCGLSSRY